VVAATAAHVHAQEFGPAAPAQPPPGYIVVPFENKSPVKALDWQASALAMTVAEKLEVHPGLRPAYGPAVLDGLDASFDPEKVARRARDLGAKWVFAGSFSRPNWKAEVTLKLFTVVEPSNEVPNATLRLVAESSSVGERNDLLKLLDDNLFAVLQKAGWTPESDVAAQIKRRPTKDLYAFTLYGRALNQYFGFGTARDSNKAVTSLHKVNLIDPKMAEAHRLMGVVLLDQGKAERAQGQYSYALDLKPNYYAAMAGLAKLYRVEGNRARAQEMVEKALEIRTWDVDMRVMLGEILWETAELDRALAELEKVVAIAPRHLQARRTLALIYAAKGQTNDLAAELERIAQLAPDDIDVKLDLGSAYQRMGDTTRAIGAYEEILKRDPRNVQALKFAGDCYRRARDTDKAIAAYQRVMKLSPSDPRPYFLLGAVYEEAGNDNKAEQVFQGAQQFRRYLGEAWSNLGAIAYRRGDLSKATWYLSRAVVRAPTRPKGHYNYALLLSAKKERDKALDELKIAGDLDPQDADIRYLSGVILLRQGRLDEARGMFEEALKRAPQHADAKHNLALLDDLERRYGGEHASGGAR
jgi:Flp pilus assembly protein TadD